MRVTTLGVGNNFPNSIFYLQFRYYIPHPPPLSIEACHVRVVMLVKEYKAMTQKSCCKTNFPMDMRSCLNLYLVTS